MSVDFNIMAGGEAGQGVQSIGSVLARTMAYGGLHVFADQDYENRVRGGHNFFHVRVSDQEVLAISGELDILIALNQETVDLHRMELKKGGVIIFDSEQTKLDTKGDSLFSVPLARLANESAKNKLMTNTVAIGAAVGLGDRYRVGGGNGPDVYVALCAADGKKVYQARGVNNQAMQKASWDLAPFTGKKMFIKIVDIG